MPSLIVFTFAAGCVAPAISPAPARVAAIEKLLVVPLEAPPLLMTDALATPLGAAFKGGIGAGPGEGALVVLLVAGTIALVQSISSASKESATVPLSELVTKGIVWSPTRTLADEAATQLRAAVPTRTISTSPNNRHLEIGSPEATWHMENWYGPIRGWYSSDTADINDATAAGRYAGVLEIGLLNYEWHTDRLAVQVMMRLIDADTARVLGRTRQWSSRSIGRAREVFAEDNSRLKTMFLDLSRPLVRAGLKELRLLQ